MRYCRPRGVIEVRAMIASIPARPGLERRGQATPSRAIYAALLTAQAASSTSSSSPWAMRSISMPKPRASPICSGGSRSTSCAPRSRSAVQASASRRGGGVGATAPQAGGTDLDGPGTARRICRRSPVSIPRLDALGARASCCRGRTSTRSNEPASRQAVQCQFYDTIAWRSACPTAALRSRARLLMGQLRQLNGIDWQKGCHMGQELTARMKYQRAGEEAPAAGHNRRRRCRARHCDHAGRP